MAKKKKQKQSQHPRKALWERSLERFIAVMKLLLLPALAIWVLGWLWLGGVFTATQNMMWQSFVQWTATQGLVVEDVVIEGRHRTDLSQLNAAITIRPQDPLLAMDLTAMQNRIEGLNWVDQAVVSRSYSGIVTVRLVEKFPFVVWDRPGTGRVVIDTKGTIIRDVDPAEYAHLLNVRGVDAPDHTVDLMRLILAEPDVADFIAGAEWIGDRRWDLMTTMGVRIHLPEQDMGLALARLAASQTDKNILERDLLSIDLRGADRIIIETKRGRTQDLMNLSSTHKTNTI